MPTWRRHRDGSGGCWSGCRPIRTPRCSEVRSAPGWRGARAAGGMLRVFSPAAATEPADEFLTGASGQVYGIRATTRALAAVVLADAASTATATRRRLRRAARRAPRRRVLALGVERPE